MGYNKEYQRQYYLEHREEKLAYAKKRNQEMTDKERKQRADYMRQYREENPEKWERTKEERKKMNARRRELYARDKWRREQARIQAKEWAENHPKKRKAQRLKEYNLTLKQFNQMLEAQDDKCAICGYSDKSDSNMFPLVDHCHETGKVRGLLCMNCNQALGKFQDNPKLLKKAINYLKINGSSGVD